MTESAGIPPILRDKHWQEPSAFTPESLLREARRQKQASTSPVPEVCILDPDGDIVRGKRAEGVTNQMGQEGDFEKGDGNGVSDALELIERAAQRLLPL